MIWTVLSCYDPDYCQTGYLNTTHCFGKVYTDDLTCNGHGKCIENEVCHCDSDWSGENCEILSCFNITEPSQVCSNNGNCTDKDTCSCREGYYGIMCQFMNCTLKCGPNGKCSIINTTDDLYM